MSEPMTMDRVFALWKEYTEASAEEHEVWRTYDAAPTPEKHEAYIAACERSSMAFDMHQNAFKRMISEHEQETGVSTR